MLRFLAARGEHRQIGASTDPAAVAALAALAALAQLQQLAHSVSDAIAVAPQPAWLASAASAVDPASDASAAAPAELSAHLTAEPSDPASAAASAELSAHLAAEPSAPDVDPPELPAYIDPPLLHWALLSYTLALVDVPLLVKLPATTSWLVAQQRARWLA